ncbi:MAG: hypothetical protein QM775_00570 [Pirellulales bacterium]
MLVRAEVRVAPSSVETSAPAAEAELKISLRDPVVAGILAWLIPGAGHWYQGRRTKALLFFFCIYATFFYGLWLGGGRVVYAAWGPSSDDKRLPYLCQIGTGAVALPALWQAQRYGNEKYVAEMQRKEDAGTRTFAEWFMAPPMLEVKVPGYVHPMKEIDLINYQLNRRFELGTVYTMVAGLLNLLVVFDALGGPAYGSASASPEASAAGSGPESGSRLIRPASPESPTRKSPLRLEFAPFRKPPAMNFLVPLFAARLNELWYALPLIISISVVYSGTRDERADDILVGTVRSLVWIVAFMSIIMAVLWAVGLMV